MAKDFRELLVEASRHDVFGRFFKELQIGFKAVLSFQASKVHSCEPAETLDDVYQYTQWEVQLRQIDKPVDIPGIGLWDQFKQNEWAKKFDRPEFQRAMVGEFVTTEEAQQILEDVIDYAIKSNHIESEDEIIVLEADIELKKLRACTGCSGSAAK
ncbi:hypothetical protein [Pseudodesulfovibrio sp.]|uniref:hypothetical protein n=1 Tax=unclassified Pseudodesulfovibrio TaxID=2661612 RepID=UPI003B00F001